MIGVFDSGVGGLGVFSHVSASLPRADIVYVADRANAPYGSRSLDEVRFIATGVARGLIDMGATTVVVACNTASAAALHHLREAQPETTFVGMEVAIKPAIPRTNSRVVGVLATEATFQSELYDSVVRRYAAGTRVVTAACPDWVDLVERGMTDGAEVDAAVRRRIEPLLDSGADTLVLGCTHFPFLRKSIAAVAGATVSIVDPAPAVARQVARVHQDRGAGIRRLMSTGDPTALENQARALIGFGNREPALAFPR